jgi:uncharacterized protein (TIGR02646 family)
MIKYDLPPKPPQLTPELQARLTQEFRENPNKAVWNKPWLKEAVLQKSFGKCCYSEIKLGEESKYMEIDHFMPKSGYPDLVVEWENLNPSCKTCNIAKSDHDPNAAYIIHPFRDDPKEYIYLRNYRYYGKDDCGTGETTIRVLNLNNWRQFVLVRKRIGSGILTVLENLLDDRALFFQPDYVERRLYTLKTLMRKGDRHEEYAAVVSTVILNDENYRRIEALLRDRHLWDDELEELKSELTFCALLS